MASYGVERLRKLYIIVEDGDDEDGCDQAATPCTCLFHWLLCSAIQIITLYIKRPALENGNREGGVT